MFVRRNGTGWCEQVSTEVLPPGEYQVVMEVYSQQCFPQLPCEQAHVLVRSEDHGTVTIPGPPPVGDLDGDGSVGVSDLLIVLGAWGPCRADCAADLDESGDVGVPDLLLLLSNWG